MTMVNQYRLKMVNKNEALAETTELADMFYLVC